MRLVMSNAVITAPGLYEYRHVDIDDARKWLDRGPFTSRIRFPATADALRLLFDVAPTVDRTAVHMVVGDEALIFRLTAKISADKNTHLTPGFVMLNHELGILRRIG